MSTKPCMKCGTQVKQRRASKFKPDFWLCDECLATEVSPETDPRYRNFIVTTSHTIEGQRIVRYLDVISAQSVKGLGLFKDFGAGISDITGGSAKGYERELDAMRKETLTKLKDRALAMGATAVISVDLDYGDLKGSMLMLVANGTAVIAEST